MPGVTGPSDKPTPTAHTRRCTVAPFSLEGAGTVAGVVTPVPSVRMVARVTEAEHVRHNREFWDSDADDYQAAHGADLDARPLAWGAFRIPEDELRVLGDVAYTDVLELGCGAAQWAIALADRGARPVGLDVSLGQLRHARSRAPLPLVNASGDRLPFRDSSFDLVFCDHGAPSFCDPAVLLPEVARVLRPRGVFAFCAAHPLLYLTWNGTKERQSRRLHLRYRDLGRIAFAEGTCDWVLPPGDWVRLFRTNGFVVENLIELCAPKHAKTTYDQFVTRQWAARWPAEWIWRVRHAPS